MTQEEELLERIKRLRTIQEPEMAQLPLQRDYRLPQEPEVSTGGVDPRLTRADELERQAQPPVRQGGLVPQLLKSTLEGIASSNMPGGYMAYRQQQDQNERQRQQDLLARVNQLRSQSADAEQLGLQRRTVGMNEQKLAGDLNEQLARVNLLRNPKPEFSSGTQGMIYNKETGEVTNPGVTPIGNRTVERDGRKFIEYFHQSDPSTVLHTADAGVATGEPLYPVMEGGKPILRPRSQAAGQATPTTIYQASGMPSVGGVPGISTTPPPPIPDTTQASLAGWKQSIGQIDAILPQLRSAKNALGPLTGRIKLAEIEKLGGLGATPEQIKLAVDIRRSLMSQAFAEGGKQLTPTELGVFEGLTPALTDTMEQAIIKAEQSRNYLQTRYDERLSTMPYRQRAQIPEAATPATRDISNASAPAIGTIENGYIFQGGNPADPNSWKKQ